jgi:TIR domain
MTMSAHVFLSYVRENSALIDRLKDDLAARGAQVWLDRDILEPGARWRAEIRRAIRKGKFFIACFSSEYVARDDTWMNEELTLAIEELRKRPIDRTWFIAVKLSPCEIPEREIGAGQTLRDLQHLELYPDWGVAVDRLAGVILAQQPNTSTSSTTAVDNPNAKDGSVKQGGSVKIGKIKSDTTTIRTGQTEIEDLKTKKLKIKN